ncbi:homeobox-leucine zipper protein ROC8-like isoform X2 [Phalaenopsis equestris]|uniref:homeobox-leucine zipper protein ROC8-like isoform X2 n=1 Tax=Phalaenopsis equestris TaxID=78828 RepID=UPI0009E2432B|nr:homeobox-leucine zipper protein ROC8-like isoform X2 [Phalaenopsis equestris]
MDSGDEQDVTESKGKKKRYHRHTPRQIQELEAMFKMCPHPDEKQRMQLSRDLGLEPRQIKFWFQNRRTQMKTQHERADNCALRSENDKIRCENIAMSEALRNAICPTCGSSQEAEDSYFDEQKLRMENARLKEELDRVSTITSKYLGRPITQLPPIQPLSVSSLDLTVGGYGNPGFTPSLEIDQLGVVPAAMAFPFLTISEIERPMMVELATRSMEELIRLAQTDEPLWTRIGIDGREILDLETYERIFPRPAQQFRSPDARVESSRDSGDVMMHSLALVDMFMDSGKWMDLFPTIVSNARTVEVLMPGMDGSKSGALVLMYGEFLGLSPVVPLREFCFLRYCQQIQQGLWVISDISIFYPKENQLPSSSKRRLPSGCLIQDMPNGYSKVVWVEHMEIEEKNPIHQLYHDLVDSGIAFGAQRWVATLQRMCERIACLIVTGSSPRDLGGVIPTAEGKRSMMRLAQRMVSNFCSTLGSSNGHRWTAPAGLNDVGIRVTVHKCSDPGQPNGVFLSAATSIWMPFSPQAVFSFFRDERSRVQWDVLSNGKAVQEVTRIQNGQHPGNCISLLRAAMNPANPNEGNMLILQESCTDSSGSLVVYASVDLPSINIAMSGEDPSFIPLLPSGFIVLPDGRPGTGSDASSSSNPMGGSSGSVLTVAFQIMVSSLPSAKLNLESVATVNHLIGATVQQIKAALSTLGA